MGEVVNLRKRRKEAKKRDEAQHADANRIEHGRSKAERSLAAKRSDKMDRGLDAHKIDSGEGR